MEVNIVFVYYSKQLNKIKVLSLSEAKSQNDDLIKDGWRHTATIDPRKWMEYLFNDAENVPAEVFELAKRNRGAIILKQL